MEPRLFSHGNCACSASAWPSVVSFNGATTFRSWKPTTGCRRRSPWAGFNGATTFQSWKRGDSTSSSPAGLLCFNGATTFQSWKPANTMYLITIDGVLQWSHDFLVMETVELHDEAGSTYKLQWSHDFSVMETRCELNCAALYLSRLQWSHDFSVMETNGVYGTVVGERAASMEPRLFSHGNQHRLAPAH